MKTGISKMQQEVIKAIQDNTIMDFIASKGYMLKHQDLIDLAIELAYTLDSRDKRTEAIKNLTDKWELEW